MLKKIGSFPPAIVIAALVASAVGFLTFGGALGSSGSPVPTPFSNNASEEVLGDVIDCAVGEDTQFKLQTEDNEFKVIGLLESFDGTTAVVMGPSGDVSATLAADFELKGALATSGTDSEGAVKMEGTVDGSDHITSDIESACDGVGVVDCVVGEDPIRKLEVEGNAFMVKGTLDSLTETQASVVGPGAVVEAAVDASTDIELADDSPGTPVKMEGTVLADGSFQATKIRSACEEEVVVQQVEVELEDCNRGPGTAGDFRLRIDDDEAEIHRGTVLSASGDFLEVGDPDGDPSVVVDISQAEEIEGSPDVGDEVRVEGVQQTDGSILAEEVKVLCPHPDNDGIEAQFEDEAEDEDENDIESEIDDEDEDEDDDDDGDGDDSGSGGGEENGGNGGPG